MYRLSIAGIRIHILRENPILGRQIDKYRLPQDDLAPADLIVGFDEAYLAAERKGCAWTTKPPHL